LQIILLCFGHDKRNSLVLYAAVRKVVIACFDWSLFCAGFFLRQCSSTYGP